jgi:hypothetical protein
MPTKTSVSISVVAAVLLIAAVSIRAGEKGYHLFLAGDYMAAHAALIDNANAGDGFAAYLNGKAEETRLLGQQRAETALASYRQAAELGFLDGAIMEYRLAARLAEYSPKACEEFKKVLEWGARAGNLTAAAHGGEFYTSHHCGPADPVTAARYFGLAARLDRRLGTKLDGLLAMLSGDILNEAKQAAQMRFQPFTRQSMMDRYRALKAGAN